VIVSATGEIVPRWEWRTFGESFGGADTRLDALEVERIQESDELYVLSRHGGATVKVRDDLIDVKELEGVDPDGLEQWKPTLKAPFPLSTANVGYALQMLGVEPSMLERDVYALDELLEDVLRPNADLLVVPVHKRRSRYTLDGCLAERTEVRTDRGSTRTIAIEASDRTLVLAVVRSLGLGDRANTAYPRGLAELVGFGT
jgi:exopolyphosphatase/guanosine-5'-triphosphate,3'-diphosphate pyrophosphatase